MKQTDCMAGNCACDIGEREEEEEKQLFDFLSVYGSEPSSVGHEQINLLMHQRNQKKAEGRGGGFQSHEYNSAISFSVKQWPQSTVGHY